MRDLVMLLLIGAVVLWVIVGIRSHKNKVGGKFWLHLISLISMLGIFWRIFVGRFDCSGPSDCTSEGLVLFFILGGLAFIIYPLSLMYGWAPIKPVKKKPEEKTNELS